MATRENSLFKKYPAIQGKKGMEKLCQLVEEYCKLVNPTEITLEDVCDVRNKLDKVSMRFDQHFGEGTYKTVIELNDHYLVVGYMYNSGICEDTIPFDDTIWFEYKINLSRRMRLYGVDLTINLDRAIAWNFISAHEREVTEDDIETMSHYFEMALKEMKAALGIGMIVTYKGND